MNVIDKIRKELEQIESDKYLSLELLDHAQVVFQKIAKEFNLHYKHDRVRTTLFNSLREPFTKELMHVEAEVEGGVYIRYVRNQEKVVVTSVESLERMIVRFVSDYFRQRGFLA